MFGNKRSWKVFQDFLNRQLTNPKMSSRIVIKIFLEGLSAISKKEIKNPKSPSRIFSS
jgi:hypothetical protein